MPGVALGVVKGRSVPRIRVGVRVRVRIRFGRISRVDFLSFSPSVDFEEVLSLICHTMEGGEISQRRTSTPHPLLGYKDQN